MRRPGNLGGVGGSLADKYSWVPGTFSGYGAALPYNEGYGAKPAYTGLSNGLNPAA
ncbi:hypothetical protein [Streptomyces cyaneochromogenes]|uniref:hypothetical protein n=1 Tax=Streptomyces cyaneochromogenes TaxID=2496836 RepID=UPI0026934D88|nr:hypothetical protein [Streptomyces cyaneochromogenes]